MSTSKAERLLTLLKVLLDTDVLVTASQIRRRVPGYAESDVAFRRAFERDKVELGTMLGHPIRSAPVPGTDPPVEGYRIRPEDAYLRDPGLTPAERRTLGVAASAVRLAGVDPARGTMKVGATPGAGPPADGAGTEVPADARVVALFQAVAEQRVARFRYHDEDREVQPFRLRFTKGRWYLAGHDAARDAERQFRVDRIEGEVAVGPPGAYAPPAEVGADALDQPWAMGDGPARPVRVRVDGPRAEAARRGAPGAEVHEEAAGSVVLTLEVRNVEALRGFVLGFGEDAEVLDPPEVRAEVVAWLAALAGDGAP
ncbi:MAG TPA: WYL domain-containing protein [Acidimicrobiales bacterium]|nr:WYL domain-containing protein [Acidimicrobiales bacterium]